MEDLNDEQLNQEELSEDNEEYELSHTDKMIGLFSEPASIFEKISQAPIKVVDWLLPVIVLIIVVSLSTVVMQSNPQIRYEMAEKQAAATEKILEGYVNSGAMTQEQADAAIDGERDKMNKGGIATLIPQLIAILIFTFVVFFVISGFYFLVSKFILKGDGTYSSAMVAYGLPFYIGAVQYILIVVVAMLMNKVVTDLSVTTFLGLDKQEIVGFILSKVDLLSIWFYVVVGIAYAKMFKSENTAKYVGTIIGLWIGFSLLSFFLAKAVPFLSFLNQ